MIHSEPSPLAGKTVTLKASAFKKPVQFRVEDWCDRVLGKSWMDCDGNPVCLEYGVRAGCSGQMELLSNDVLYGKVNDSACLVHITEIEE